MKIKILAICALLIIIGTSGVYAINTYKSSYKKPQTINDLTDEEIQGLKHMREEEKLARDVYIIFNENCNNLKIFSNIAQSEQKHMDAIKQILDKFGIDDPAEGNDIGVFTNQELQSLYYQLITEGKQSITNALIVGGKIEEIDIIDLKNYIELTDKSDIKNVYNNLLEGSKNHLKAFVKEFKNLGVTYKPFYLTQEEFDEIINQVKISKNFGLKSRNRIGNIIEKIQGGQQNPKEKVCLKRLYDRTRVYVA